VYTPVSGVHCTQTPIHRSAASTQTLIHRSVYTPVSVYPGQRRPLHTDTHTPVSGVHTDTNTPVSGVHTDTNTPVSVYPGQRRPLHTDTHTPVSGVHTDTNTPVSVYPGQRRPMSNWTHITLFQRQFFLSSFQRQHSSVARVAACGPKGREFHSCYIAAWGRLFTHCGSA